MEEPTWDAVDEEPGGVIQPDAIIARMSDPARSQFAARRITLIISTVTALTKLTFWSGI